MKNIKIQDIEEFNKFYAMSAFLNDDFKVISKCGYNIEEFKCVVKEFENIKDNEHGKFIGKYAYVSFLYDNIHGIRFIMNITVNVLLLCLLIGLSLFYIGTGLKVNTFCIISGTFCSWFTGIDSIKRYLMYQVNGKIPSVLKLRTSIFLLNLLYCVLCFGIIIINIFS